MSDRVTKKRKYVNQNEYPQNKEYICVFDRPKIYTGEPRILQSPHWRVLQHFSVGDRCATDMRPPLQIFHFTFRFRETRGIDI